MFRVLADFTIIIYDGNSTNC